MPDVVLSAAALEGPAPDPAQDPAQDPAPGRALGAAAVVELLAARLAAAPAPVAGPRLLLVDGRSGSGKTDLGGALGSRLGAPVVHVEDLYPGWDGLAAAVGLLEREVLRPLRAGRVPHPPRWDWAAGRWGPRAPVPAAGTAGTVVVEGVGAGCTPVRPELLVWVRAPTAVRRRRALARDGAAYAPHWRRWAAQEEELFAAHDVAAAADVVLDSDDVHDGGDVHDGRDGAVRWRVLRG
ncbi:nucleoside/nucleotide kinase family protein [Kineococcus sp. SYSU DK005]|uniref:dephospho-CoA kinase n=1 Tax=Kineococcus sp. SYSU DK005 TaxID=3383126 RepID=UPI003D7C54A9